MISVAIVSHRQEKLANWLLEDLANYAQDRIREVVLIDNAPVDDRRPAPSAGFPITRLVNPRPRGLAANLNAAFAACTGDYFCTINPDIRLQSDVFGSLQGAIERGIGDVVAPAIVDHAGRVQDSARGLPNLRELIARRLEPTRTVSIDSGALLIRPDWIAGMFLMMRADVYRALGGMDERYYLYFEDVDFGTRARLAGYRLWVDKSARVVHFAQRASRRNPTHFYLHLRSALRFFRSPVYRQARNAAAMAGPPAPDVD